MGLIFRNGKPLIKDGKLSFCEDDCDCKHCPDCCTQILFGEFNLDGDLVVVDTDTDYPTPESTTAADITTTYKVVMPTKNSRYVCAGQYIRVEINYESDTTEIITPKTFIKWDFGWIYTAVHGADSEVNEYGIVEWNEDFSIESEDPPRGVTLKYDACWQNSLALCSDIHDVTDVGSNVGEIVMGHSSVHQQYVFTRDCPSEFWCCPHELECHPCCLFIYSTKLYMDAFPESREKIICNPENPRFISQTGGNPDIMGRFIFWDNEDTFWPIEGEQKRTRLRVAAETSEPFSRTVCPPSETDEFESGSTLRLYIDVIPNELNPDLPYTPQVCVKYDPAIWEIDLESSDPDLEVITVCGEDWLACFPASTDLHKEVQLNLKCRELGEDFIWIHNDVLVQVTDETEGISLGDRHMPLKAGPTFGYCGHMDRDGNCCNPVVCDTCCFVFDSAEGFLEWSIEGGDFHGSFLDCTDPDNPILVDVVIDLTDGRVCMDESTEITIELSEPDIASKPLCVTWTGEFDNANPSPAVAFDPEIPSVCWLDTHDTSTTYTLGLDLPRVQTEPLSISVSLGDGGGTVYFRSCNAELMPCCVCGEYDYRNCSCGCDFRVSIDPDADLCPDGEGGTITVVGGATQITDFEMALDYVTFPCEGAPVIAITQVGASWQDYTCVNSCIIENIPGDTGVWCPFSVRELHFNWARSPECHPDLPGTGTGTITPICNPDGSFKEWQVVLFNLGGIGANFTKFINGDCDSGAESGGFIDAGGVYPGVVNYDLTFNITRTYTPACGEEEGEWI